MYRALLSRQFASTGNATGVAKSRAAGGKPAHAPRESLGGSAPPHGGAPAAVKKRKTLQELEVDLAAQFKSMDDGISKLSNRLTMGRDSHRVARQGSLSQERGA